MFPESDPYSGKSGKIFDLLLILFTIAVILFAILTAPRRQHGDSQAHPNQDATPSAVATPKDLR